MVSILIPTYRRSNPGEEQSVWGDLRVALTSVAAYAPGIEVVVAWDGAEEPRDLPVNPAMRLIRRPTDLGTAGAAFNWCATQTTADDIIVMGDDCVLHPDTVPLLLADAKLILSHPEGVKLGMLGVRSNYVKGPQNIRWANQGQLQGINYDSEINLLEVDEISPVTAWIRRDVFLEVGGYPATNWFADDVTCWDLKRRGYRHFVSRAYVHHVGQRGTGQEKSSQNLWDEGIAWLRANRPDFLSARLGIA